jgi:DMSO/TMAO reductase YedYZ molybdopterin-dependent catalytic subunit
VEVREYEGESLGSIQDFRENSILGPQYINIDNYTLEISGLVDEERSMTYEEALDRQTYSKVVTVHCVEGWSVRILWEGILIEELIDEAGAKPEANTVIFHAYDGYTSSLPLDYILDNNIILAHKMNGLTLPPERGFPFQVVAEDKYGIKWVKWVTGIELSDDLDYRGFWESRGYSNEADVGGPVFG